jgi:hypothetical protein
LFFDKDRLANGVMASAFSVGFNTFENDLAHDRNPSRYSKAMTPEQAPQRVQPALLFL